MKTLEEIIKNIPNAYIWEDKETIDICIEKDDIKFNDYLKEFICPNCELQIFSKKENYLNSLSNLVKGMQFICPKCKQKYFIHSFVNSNLSKK